MDGRVLAIISERRRGKEYLVVGNSIFVYLLEKATFRQTAESSVLIDFTSQDPNSFFELISS
jgi:hypothetical protein